MYTGRGLVAPVALRRGVYGAEECQERQNDEKGSTASAGELDTARCRLRLVLEGARSLADVYRAQFKATIALQLQYRVSLLIWLVWSVLQPVVSLTVWSTVAASTGGQVGGYAPSDFAAYFLIGMWVTHVTFTWVMHEFEYRVRHGQFSPKLLRPVHPIHADIADNVAYKLLTAPVLALATLVLIWTFQPRIAPEPWALAAFVPALLLAFWIHFLTGWTLALAAFWMTRVAAVNQLYFIATVFLSGAWVPLTLLPAPIQWLSWLLPFRWMLAFPTELLMGRLTRYDTAVGLGMQLLWCVAVFALWRTFWGRAVKQYTAVGA
jgi:ABC-2 type transport system permease protein